MERKHDEGEFNRTTKERWTAKDGARVVAAWRRSGLARAEYCKRTGVAGHRLAYWALVDGAKSRPHQGSLKRPKPGVKARATFLPVVVRNTASAQDSQVAGDAGGIDARWHIDPDWAARFVRALFAAEGTR